MIGCLQKYVGTYCVRAEYDESTKDLPRLEDGSLDPSFSDVYIDCRNDIKIKYGNETMLSCYIPNKSRGMNVLRKIYKDKISKTLPDDSIYLTKLCKALVDNKVLVSAEVLDYEVYFEFNTDMIDYIAKLVGTKTSGAKTGPYQIPNKDLKLYKEAIKDFPVKTVEIHGEPRTMIDGLLIKKVTNQFDEMIIKAQPQDFNIKQDKKAKGLSGKEYIHSLGNTMWQRYCDYLKAFAEAQK